MTSKVVLLLAILSHRAIAAETSPAFDAQAEVAKLLAQQNLGTCELVVLNWTDGPATQKIALLDELAKHFLSTAKSPVDASKSDLSSTPRVKSGEMSQTLHATKHDLYIEGGKAAWAVECMLDTGAPSAIVEKMSTADRAEAAANLEAMIRIYKRGVADAQHSPPKDK